MQKIELFDATRNRKIPIGIYNSITQNRQIVIYSPGYGGGQEAFEKCTSGLRKWPYEQAEYLGNFFAKNGYTFISIQHDILGDTDGLETLDGRADQKIVRRHLWERGAKNIEFVLYELKKLNPSLNFDKFIIGGHSNGADISKFYANENPHKVDFIFSLDGRRCPLNPASSLKILHFEANETLMDDGVLPQIRNPENYNDPDPKTRENLEWIIIKPKKAQHASYCDNSEYNIPSDIEVQKQVLHALSWVLA